MELSYKNDEDQDERLNPAADTARNLSRQEEQAGYDRELGGIADNFDETADASQEDANIAKTKNMDKAKDQEERGGANWATNVSGNSPKEKFSLKGMFKKKAPLWLIGLLVGGLGSMTLLLSPALALMHIKETIVNKFDTMSSVLEERSMLVMKDRIFSTSATCRIKVKCKFKGLTSRQINRLEAQGAKLLDANGERVTQNKLTRKYTGGTTLELPSGEKVDAKSFASKYFTSSELRNVGRAVYSPRFMSFNDSIAKKIRADKKLVSNPKWGEEGDEKSTRESIHGAVSGESYDATSEHPQTRNGSDGKPLPADQQPLDFGDDTDDINREAEKLKAAAAAGEAIPEVPADPAGVAKMAPYPSTGASVIKRITGFLNPASIVTGLCTTYQITNAIVDTAKLIQLTNKMRYASQFLSTADKLTAGDGTQTEAEKAMNILERPDQYGNAFGDSFGYQNAAYNTVTDMPITSSADGNETTRMLASAVEWVNDHLGGKRVVHTTCNIVTNPFVQGALALTSFIPGAGQALKGVGALFADGGMAAARSFIEKKISSITEKKITGDALKSAAKKASADLWRMAKTPMGIFIAGYLIERFGVPYIARAISGTDLTGDESGPVAMDTTITGFNAINAATARQRAMTPLTKNQFRSYVEFNNQSTATYIADMQASSGPFDLTNPYSTGSTMASAYYMFASKFNTFSSGTFNWLSAPAAILSSLNPMHFISSSTLADDQVDASLNYCPDAYLQSQDLATTPDCSVIYGFNDLAMLKNTDPDTGVVDWMLNNHQIDDDGNPVPGSAFADFQSKCVDGADMKMISDVGDESRQLDEECYDATKNDTTEFKMFRLYNIDGGVNDGVDNGAEGTPPGGATAAPTGDAASLAQQILASPNVQFQVPVEKTLFQTIADTGKQTLINGPSPVGGTIQGCDGTTQIATSPKLMSLILAASQKYKLTLGVAASGHDCDGGYHPQGQAIDINGVAHLDQPFVHNYTWTGSQVAMAKEFYEFLDSTAGQSGTKLELGQKYCFGNTPPQLSNGTLVKDDCTHIHVGVTSP